MQFEGAWVCGFVFQVFIHLWMGNESDEMKLINYMHGIGVSSDKIKQ